LVATGLDPAVHLNCRERGKSRMDCRIRSGNDEISRHCIVDNRPYFSYICFRISSDDSVAAWRHSRRARASAVPAGGFATRSRRHWVLSAWHYDQAAMASLDWDR